MNAGRLVLGLAPSLTAMGWALVELGRHAGADRYVDCGVWRTRPRTKRLHSRACAERAADLSSALASMLDEARPMAIHCAAMQVVPTPQGARVALGCGVIVAHAQMRNIRILHADVPPSVLGRYAWEGRERALVERFGSRVSADVAREGPDRVLAAEALEALMHGIAPARRAGRLAA